MKWKLFKASHNQDSRFKSGICDFIFRTSLEPIFLCAVSFLVIHKVDNIGIFVQLLMEINLKLLRTESVSMQIGIYQGVLNSY